MTVATFLERVRDSQAGDQMLVWRRDDLADVASFVNTCVLVMRDVAAGRGCEREVISEANGLLVGADD